MIAALPAEGVLVTVLGDEVPDDGEIAALPAEGVLGEALTEEILSFSPLNRFSLQTPMRRCLW